MVVARSYRGNDRVTTGGLTVAVVIPTLDEAASIAAVIAEMPTFVDTVVVADNNSRDGTAAIAAKAGATVVLARRRGYGYACHVGVAAAPASDVVVFLDGDGSMPPAEIVRLLAPITVGDADVVCGRRRLAPGLMPWHQQLGNRVIALLLRGIYGVRLSELGSFRAVRTSTLTAIDLPGSRFRWPAQLLARAARIDARIVEVDVAYAARTGGRSKVGGSVKGTLAASWDIAAVLIADRRWSRP